ncbi:MULTISPECIES: HNH endonuclease signature motif containing protein [unclassified Halomonas]|uniref:HNH endonuclease n=1 Tax=unclassified Halomonas TaxID=2609666 RepID=UPI002076905E|nr:MULTISPECIES: HNH endonuclease signature motif containing protein [unclassified Halomonas]
MYEISKGYKIRLEKYRKRHRESTLLFEKVGAYLNDNFNWKNQSAISQEKKPKYRLTLNENVSRRPNISIIPYKDNVRIRIAHRPEDEAMLIQSLPVCFEKIIYKDKNGSDVSAFVFTIKELAQLKFIQGIHVEKYFSPNAKETSNKVPDGPSQNSDREFTDEVMLAAIKTRKGQPYFRKKLLDRYEKTCIVTGCRIVSLLEAAHIVPHSKKGGYDLDNGLLLRSDIHNLFDLNLLSIDGDGVLHVSSLCQGSEYEKYNQITILKDISMLLRVNLNNRFKKFKI